MYQARDPVEARMIQKIAQGGATACGFVHIFEDARKPGEGCGCGTQALRGVILTTWSSHQ
jgi:hypothetical protein